MITAGIELTGLLGDVVFLAIVLAFFGVLVGLVKVCDHIVGPDSELDASSAEAPDGAPVDGVPADTEVAA